MCYNWLEATGSCISLLLKDTPPNLILAPPPELGYMAVEKPSCLPRSVPNPSLNQKQDPFVNVGMKVRCTITTMACILWTLVRL